MKEFTEFDKELARHISSNYNWIARNAVGNLYLFESKPSREQFRFASQHGDMMATLLPIYNVFEPVRWSNNEPTLIRNIYDPQILTDTEREYLKAVLKPFRNEILRVVKANDGEDKEFIYVELNKDAMLYRFPSFKKDEKYVGMKSGYPYRLHELGITYD